MGEYDGGIGGQETGELGKSRAVMPDFFAVCLALSDLQIEMLVQSVFCFL